MLVGKIYFSSIVPSLPDIMNVGEVWGEGGGQTIPLGQTPQNGFLMLISIKNANYHTWNITVCHYFRLNITAL